MVGEGLLKLSLLQQGHAKVSLLLQFSLKVKVLVQLHPKEKIILQVLQKVAILSLVMYIISHQLNGIETTLLATPPSVSKRVTKLSKPYSMLQTNDGFYRKAKAAELQ